MFFIKSVGRVRKHETQSNREFCVFHFSHFELYLEFIFCLAYFCLEHFRVS